MTVCQTEYLKETKNQNILQSQCYRLIIYFRCD